MEEKKVNEVNINTLISKENIHNVEKKSSIKSDAENKRIEFRAYIIKIFNNELKEFSDIEGSNTKKRKSNEPEIKIKINKSFLEISYNRKDKVHEFKWNLLSNIIFRNNKEANEPQIELFIKILDFSIDSIENEKISLIGKLKKD